MHVLQKVYTMMCNSELGKKLTPIGNVASFFPGPQEPTLLVSFPAPSCSVECQKNSAHKWLGKKQSKSSFGFRKGSPFHYGVSVHHWEVSLIVLK
jgi:hypothetical protein